MAVDDFEKAKRSKNDEFYTQLSDIETELRHYREHFKGKTIFCNCDDPFESNFFKYFAMNFNFLELKKLIATCYASSPVAGEQLSLFDVLSLDKPAETTKQAHKIEITEVIDENSDGAIDLSDVEYLLKNKKNALTLLNGDGDFRSAECIELLKEADIVVTNPPFSLFREFVAQLMEFNKRLLIIGNNNAITYKDTFKLFTNGRMWKGVNNGAKEYRIPTIAGYEHLTISRIDENGNKYTKMGNTGWYTNLDFKKRHEFLTLYKKYTPEEYPTYVNYNAIEVSKVAEIPDDYSGEMGVPITYLDKHNPEQFEIIGSSRWLGRSMSEFAPKGSYVQGGIRFYLLDKKTDSKDNLSERNGTERNGTERNGTERNGTERNGTEHISLPLRQSCYQA